MAVIEDSAGRHFSRRDLVLAVANKDGGAHVDPQLDDSYVALSRMNSIGFAWIGPNGVSEPLDSPVPASVRQIAYEVAQTLERHDLGTT
jgi:hypothetical protein